MHQHVVQDKQGLSSRYQSVFNIARISNISKVESDLKIEMIKQNKSFFQKRGFFLNYSQTATNNTTKE